jgi:phage portal protein BeeE
MGMIKAYQEWRSSLRDSDHESSGLTTLNLKTLSSLPQHGGANGWLDLRGNYTSPYYYTNTKVDYSAEVGDLRTSTLVMAAIQWVATCLADARLRVVEYGADRTETEVENHPAAMMWDRPNPYYSFHTLLCGFAVSWITASCAYFMKTKAQAGNLLWLWYEPHWTIRPRWTNGAKELISYYEILRDGKWIRVEVEDVVFIANGVDPETRRGMINPNTALLREYWTDNQVAQFTAQMFKKGLVPPVVVALKNFSGGPDKLREIKSDLVRRMSGDAAGEPMVTGGEVDVHKLGFDYSSFGFKEIRQIPEERFCANWQISPHSLHFGTAAQTSTYSNVRQYLQHDYRSFIVRLHNLIAKELNVQLLPDFGTTDNLSVSWDYSQTALMQPDKAVEWKLVFEGFKSRVFSRAQALEGIGYKHEKGDEEIFYPVPQTHITVNPVEDEPPSEPLMLNEPVFDEATGEVKPS